MSLRTAVQASSSSSGMTNMPSLPTSAQLSRIFFENKENTISTIVCATTNTAAEMLFKKYLTGTIDENTKTIEEAIQDFYKFCEDNLKFDSNDNHEQITKDELLQIKAYLAKRFEEPIIAELDIIFKEDPARRRICTQKEAFAIVWHAVRDLSVYKILDNNSNSAKDLKSRALTFINSMKYLRRSGSSVCHLGFRNELIMGLNKVYPGIDVIEDVTAFLMHAASNYIIKELNAKTPEERYRFIRSWIRANFDTNLDSNTQDDENQINSFFAQQKEGAKKYLDALLEQKQVVPTQKILDQIKEKIFSEIKNLSKLLEGTQSQEFIELKKYLGTLPKTIDAALNAKDFDKVKISIKDGLQNLAPSSDKNTQIYQSINTLIALINDIPSTAHYKTAASICNMLSALQLPISDIDPIAPSMQAVYSLQYNSNDQRTKALTKIRKILEEPKSFAELKEVDRDSLKQLIQIEDLYKKYQAYKQFVFLQNNERTAKILLEINAAYENQNLDPKKFADLKDRFEKITRDEHIDFVQNFFAIFNSSANQSNALLKDLFNSETCKKILLSDVELSKLLPSGATGEKEISLYDINRILLHAILVPTGEWSKEFYRCFSLVRNFLNTNINNVTLGGNANLANTSYPAEFLSLLNELNYSYVDKKPDTIELLYALLDKTDNKLDFIMLIKERFIAAKVLCSYVYKLPEQEIGSYLKSNLIKKTIIDDPLEFWKFIDMTAQPAWTEDVWSKNQRIIATLLELRDEVLEVIAKTTQSLPLGPSAINFILNSLLPTYSNSSPDLFKAVLTNQQIIQLISKLSCGEFIKEFITLPPSHVEILKSSINVATKISGRDLGVYIYKLPEQEIGSYLKSNLIKKTIIDDPLEFWKFIDTTTQPAGTDDVRSKNQRITATLLELRDEVLEVIAKTTQSLPLGPYAINFILNYLLPTYSNSSPDLFKAVLTNQQIIQRISELSCGEFIDEFITLPPSHVEILKSSINVATIISGRDLGIYVYKLSIQEIGTCLKSNIIKKIIIADPLEFWRFIYKMSESAKTSDDYAKKNHIIATLLKLQNEVLEVLAKTPPVLPLGSSAVNFILNYFLPSLSPAQIETMLTPKQINESWFVHIIAVSTEFQESLVQLSPEQRKVFLTKASYNNLLPDRFKDMLGNEQITLRINKLSCGELINEFITLPSTHVKILFKSSVEVKKIINAKDLFAYLCKLSAQEIEVCLKSNITTEIITEIVKDPCEFCILIDLVYNPVNTLSDSFKSQIATKILSSRVNTSMIMEIAQQSKILPSEAEFIINYALSILSPAQIKVVLDSEQIDHLFPQIVTNVDKLQKVLNNLNYEKKTVVRESKYVKKLTEMKPQVIKTNFFEHSVSKQKEGGTKFYPYHLKVMF